MKSTNDALSGQLLSPTSKPTTVILRPGLEASAINVPSRLCTNPACGLAGSKRWARASSTPSKERKRRRGSTSAHEVTTGLSIELPTTVVPHGPGGGFRINRSAPGASEGHAPSTTTRASAATPAPAKPEREAPSSSTFGSEASARATQALPLLGAITTESFAPLG